MIENLVQTQLDEMKKQEDDFRERNNGLLLKMDQQREELLGKIKNKPRVQIVNGKVTLEEGKPPLTAPVQKITDLLQANPVLIEPVTKYLNTLISKIDVAVKGVIESGLA